ncbi:membrane primary amine oxidase, partial [Fusarium flagelliforme]
MTKGMFCKKRHNHKSFDYYLACDVSKALRWSPRNKRRRATRAGFIHVDTFKVNPPGINGQQWGIIATDDRHRMRWSYTFTRKSMASESLSKLISALWTQYKVRVHTIQMDGGSELYRASIKGLERTHGVRIIRTPPYTPEFNGVAERSNRVIFDKVRTTIESEQIPSELWPFVLQDMVRKTNCTTTRAVDGLTPLESFLNEVSPGQDNKPDLSGERICGSQVTIHIITTAALIINQLNQLSQFIASIKSIPVICSPVISTPCPTPLFPSAFSRLSQPRTVAKQLEEASVGELPPNPTIEDLPKVVWKNRRFVQEDSLARKGAKGRKSWIRSHGMFFIELNLQDQPIGH